MSSSSEFFAGGELKIANGWITLSVIFVEPHHLLLTKEVLEQQVRVKEGSSWTRQLKRTGSGRIERSGDSY